MPALITSVHAYRMLTESGATVTVGSRTRSTTVDATTLKPVDSFTDMSGPIPAIVTPQTTATTDRSTTDERDTAIRRLIVRVESGTRVDVGWWVRIEDHPDPAIVGLEGTVIGFNAGYTLHRSMIVQIEGGTV